jgi:hypothetical protein
MADLKENTNSLLEGFKSKFDFSNFNWKEATSNDAGKSSAALFLSFFYGLSLVLMTISVTFILVYNSFEKLNVDFTSVFLFIGTQMGVVFGYLFARKASDNNLTIKTN